jgi:hypothetical protein
MAVNVEAVKSALPPLLNRKQCPVSFSFLSHVDHFAQRQKCLSQSHVHVLRTFILIFRVVILIIFIKVEQLVLPLFAGLASVISGVTAGFFGKSNFVMVEAESDSGVAIRN